VSDSEHTLFTSLDSCTSLQIGRYTTGRLTKPYPGGPMLSHSPRNVEPEPGSNDNIFMRGTISFHLNHFGMKRVYLIVKCYPTTRLIPKQKNSNGHRFLFRYLSRIRYFWRFGKRQYRKLPSWAGFAAYSFFYFEGRTELHFLLKVRLRPYWRLHPDLTAGP
jgi:hypothetical protein